MWSTWDSSQHGRLQVAVQERVPIEQAPAAGTHQVSTCVMLANGPLTKSSHVSKARVAQGWNIRRYGSWGPQSTRVSKDSLSKKSGNCYHLKLKKKKMLFSWFMFFWLLNLASMCYILFCFVPIMRPLVQELSAPIYKVGLQRLY